MVLRHIARRTVPQAIILLYHRVADTDSDPQLLCVSPKNFADHMEVLRTTCRPTSLHELTKRKTLNIWGPPRVAITFDDGYADNFTNAKPILLQNEIPATVFVTTGFVGTKQTPYWDELANIFLHSPTLPSILTLLANGQIKSWEFDGERHIDVTWNVLQKNIYARQSAYQTLCDYLRSLPPHTREQVMNKIREWSGFSETVTTDNLFMTVEQLQRITDDGVVVVGAHTITHPNLACLPIQEQRREIVAGKRQLEEMTGHKVCSFAYPYGDRDSYTSETVHIIQEEGFDCACSNYGGTVWFGSNRCQLPRMLVRNWSAEEFSDHMRRLLVSG
jgi:peptidoglycan/xylan/chitin deacetylase (PgdA/CDA1 family)